MLVEYRLCDFCGLRIEDGVWRIEAGEKSVIGSPGGLLNWDAHRHCAEAAANFLEKEARRVQFEELRRTASGGALPPGVAADQARFEKLMRTYASGGLTSAEKKEFMRLWGGDLFPPPAAPDEEES